jgi:translation initiation factor IF-2
MGHIDHGKSTLLDYIRKSNVVAGEAGGITQHLSAYEIKIPFNDTERAITFLDTPGHAAFTGMRERGALAADIAILVVSAEDGVKAQTIEALTTIRNAQLPFIVAINKIDRPGANIDRAKMMLAEQDVLVEGYGGTTPWVGISALHGTNIEELLETVLLVADIENFTYTPTKPAEGIVIESRLDPKRGVAATIVLKDGTLTKGRFVAAGTSYTTTRMMENFLGKAIAEAIAGMPVQLIGFNSLPAVGSTIATFDSKRDAEEYCAEQDNLSKKELTADIEEGTKIIPVIIKADVFGTAEAIEKEIKKISVEKVHVKIIGKGIGAISEADIKLAQSDKETIIVGFNVALDSAARDLNEKVGATIETFSIIYKLTEWLEVTLEERRPRITERIVSGALKVLKVFSKTKERQVVGCRLENGVVASGAIVSIVRRDFALAEGKIIEIQQAKQKVREVQDGECGILLECKTDIAPGDVLEAFNMQQR